MLVMSSNPIKYLMTISDTLTAATPTTKAVTVTVVTVVMSALRHCIEWYGKDCEMVMLVRQIGQNPHQISGEKTNLVD